jgi:tRNA A-37 threonylcarbamoyl transferase component Bud32
VPQSPRPPESTGRVIGGRYVIEEALGRGGMAAVYRVSEMRTGKKLALKRSWARSTRKELKRRAFLEREYQTLAHLSHPCIIEVYDYGIDEDGPYYTMELLDGADLDKTGQLPWREACALLRDVASSLAILHRRGLLHRDVSAGNVRRTADGRGKLIDFGAMASIGIPSEVIGTPPYMAPEVLQMQSLDARADLFSLGALAHYLVTGRHAYPARKLADLRDVWRSRPAPPARLVPEIPAALSQLIVQLLALDRAARPQSAAEVMERLCTIAELPIEELGDVSRAYLATPTLVGREKALLSVRSRMLALVRGDGGTLLVDGVGGSGRSRLLDACVLEGKLLGAQAARADAGDAAQGDWGVARALCSQLIELFPTQAAEATRLSRDVLCHVLDELRVENATLVSATPPERSLILRELRDFVLAVSRDQRVLLVVDDADRIDEPSAALLAAIAYKIERHGLVLALAVERGALTTRSPSLQLLSAASDHVELEALDAEQTEALVRSVFGDAANLQLCAGRIHALAQGNPRTTLELAQDLLDRGLARYEAGSWLLPSHMSDSDLPGSLAESLHHRIEHLTRDARELAEALCLADGYALALTSYRALTTHRDQKRVFQALQELEAARVLITDSERYRFSQRGFLAVLKDAMPEARRHLLHSRLADLLASSAGDPIWRAHHLLHAKREAQAIELLCGMDLLARLPPIALLERAIAYAERDASLPKRVLHLLRMALLYKAPLVGAIESFRRCLSPVLWQLEQDSGLALYHELSELPVGERLLQAIGRQQQRHLATPEHERVYGAVDAIRELARLSGAAITMAVGFFDLALIESLPSLEPLLPLSPAVQVIVQLTEAGVCWIRGRVERSRELYERVCARIAEPDRSGLDDVQFERTRLGVQYGLALIEASMSISAVEQRAKLLEQSRSMRVAAWRVRMLLHLNQGDTEAARKCMRRSEMLQLQDAAEAHYVGSTAGFEMLSSAMAGDLLGVKGALDALERLAQQHAGWRPMSLFGQSRYRELQGDLSAALEIALAGLELARPGQHVNFVMLAASHVRLLAALGRLDEAVQVGTAYLETCAHEQLVPSDRFIRVELAQACARSGRHEQALRLIEDTIRWSESIGAGGLSLGVLYEARARIALAMHDRSAFSKFSERCAIEYRKGSNPVLSARFAELLDDAGRQQLAPPEGSLDVIELLESQRAETEHGTLRSRLFECVDRSDRARCSLTLLLQDAESFQGYLYGLENSHLVVLAGLPDLAVEAGMTTWLTAWVSAEQTAEAATCRAPDGARSSRPPGNSGSVTEDHQATGTLDSEAPGPRHAVPDRYVDCEGRQFEASLLIGSAQQQRRIAGVLALHVARSPQRRPRGLLLRELADHLLEQGDVTGAQD